MNIQCLPDSRAFTHNKEGRTWSRPLNNNGITILVNPRHLRIVEIGVSKQGNTEVMRPHITKSNKQLLQDLYRNNNMVLKDIEREIWKRQHQKKLLEKRSIKSKNKRIPPNKKVLKAVKEENKGSNKEDSNSGSNKYEQSN